MNRFDIAQGIEPEPDKKGERPLEPYRPRSISNGNSKIFYLRRQGGEEVEVNVQDFNVEFYDTGRGPGMFVCMTFPMTQEQSKKLMGT